LVQQLEENTLDFTIGTGLRVETFGSDGVDLIDEDYRGGVLSGHSEHVPDHARTFTEVLLHELGANHTDELCGCAVRDRFHEHGLAGSWRTVEEHTSWWVDTDLFVEIEVR